MQRRKRMGRKRYITDDELIILSDKYLYEKCEGNPEFFKIPEFGNYLRENGYPEVKDYIIRRSEPAMEHIYSLQDNQENRDLSTLAVYKTLDVDAFLTRNNSMSALKKSLTELSMYYKRVVESSSRVHKNGKEAIQRYKQTEKNFKKLSAEFETLKEKEEQLTQQIKTLKKENKTLQTIIDTYVYPEIANELLQQHGLIKETQGLIDTTAIEKHIIKSDTEIKSGSNVIRGMFGRFSEESV